jgi:hypothetical protein
VFMRRNFFVFHATNPSDEIMPLVDSVMMDITQRIICNKIVS